MHYEYHTELGLYHSLFYQHKLEILEIFQYFAKYDFELIKQDLINHFHIRQGEKLSDPGFGTIIWDMLFEPFTSDVQDAIVELSLIHI